MKAYRTIPIAENHEPLEPLSPESFCLTDPHPYQAAGAPYGNESPWWLRARVRQALIRVQDALQIHREGWRLKLHDAYRPNAVQAFMVEQEYQLLARAEGLVALSPQDRERLMPRVLALWGLPSDDPATPPPHSTGAAIDCTLVDETGREVPMGCPIDENSPRALPDAFADAPDATGKIAHIHRVLLNSLMRAEGFHRHPAEWWHFSKGDQMWAFEERQRGVTKAVAIYGRAVAETRIGVPNAAVAQG